MKKDLLTLLGCSSSLAITLMSVSSVQANDFPVKEYVFTATGEETEVLSVEYPQDLITDDIDLENCGCQSTEVTDTEGDLAIALYGCDCAGCRFLVQNQVNRKDL